jgi:hypothetical protein
LDVQIYHVGDIDLIIVATTTPDRLAPSTAVIVQDKIKANKSYKSLKEDIVREAFPLALTPKPAKVKEEKSPLE